MYPSLTHEWFDKVWNHGDESAIPRLLAPGAIMHNPQKPGGSSGPPAFVEHYHSFRSAFPNVHVIVHNVFEDGGYEASRWTFTGTHTGEGLGVPPTGRKIELPGMSFVRFEQGQAVEVWDSWDVSNLMLQLGHEPSALAAGAE